MNLDKYQRAWKAEASKNQMTFDANMLSNEVQQSLEAFQAIIFWRDVREVGTSLLMIPLWIVMGIGMSLPWTWYLTVPSLLWIAGFMLLDRRRHPQHPSDPGEPLVYYAKESLAQVDHQIWLLRNVVWWYLLPPSVSIMAFFIQTSLEITQSWWGCVLLSGFSAIFLFLTYGWIYRLNQMAVRKQLEPRRNDLNRLITFLESDSEAAVDSEMMDFVSALSGTGSKSSFGADWACWAENWNRIIPSWREVAWIAVPTATGAYLGFRFPRANMGPLFFQSVVAAVIPFEIAFFSLWYRSYQRYKGHPLTGNGNVRLHRPARVTIAMILLITCLAFAAIVSFAAGAKTQTAQGDDQFNGLAETDMSQ